jgi:hypothetical protein
MTAPLRPDELALAHAQPVRFVLRRALSFAAFYALVTLVLAVLVPGWADGERPRQTLFVAVVGGVLGAVLLLGWARQSRPPGREGRDRPTPDAI